MASYDALRHVTVGQYIPTDSLIHRLDPRSKLLALAMLIAAVLVAASFLTNIILLLYVLGAVGLARLSLRHMLASIRPALPVIFVLIVLQFLFYGYTTPGSTASVLVAWGPFRISTDGLRLALISLLRFLDLLVLTSLLTNTTTTGALTHGIESLLRPLSALGLPGHEIAFVGAIALRFVPILGEQLESIAKAQASRGVGESEGRWHLVRNARRTASLIVPLFVDAYRRSEEMILAMQSRCYRGGRGRTRLRELKLARRDYVTLGLAALMLVGVVLLQKVA